MRGALVTGVLHLAELSKYDKTAPLKSSDSTAVMRRGRDAIGPHPIVNSFIFWDIVA